MLSVVLKKKVELFAATRPLEMVDSLGLGGYLMAKSIVPDGYLPSHASGCYSVQPAPFLGQII